MVLELSRDEAGTEPELAEWARSWEMRLVAALPFHPIVTGLLFAGVLVAAYAAVEALFGRPPAQPEEVAGIPVQVLGFSVAALAGGYTLAAGYLINASNAHALEELHPVLSPPSPDPADSPRVSLRTSRWWGAAGVLVSLGFSYSVDEAVRQLLHGTRVTADAIASLIVVPLAF